MIPGLRLIALLCALYFGMAPSVEAAPPTGTFSYVVTHPDHGEIGTYTNVIQRKGEDVTVNTSVRIAVKVAFVPVYKLDADRREEWKAGRLVAYRSVTRKNGKEIKVEGRAEGDKFVIEGPAGKIAAPADVFPMNPWSTALTKADMVMASESGKVYDARVAVPSTATLSIDGQTVPTRHFEVVADTTHDVWFDGQDRVVQFATLDDGKKISFLLRR